MVNSCKERDEPNFLNLLQRVDNSLINPESYDCCLEEQLEHQIMTSLCVME